MNLFILNEKMEKYSKCLNCKKKISQLLNFGSQPVCHHFLKSPEIREEKYMLSLGICKNCGLLQLYNLFPNISLVPKYKWIKYNEPEEHLADLSNQIKKLIIKNKAKIGGISYKDLPLINLLNNLGLNNTEILKYDYLIENLGVEQIQEFLNPITAKQISERKGKFDLIIARHILEHCHNIEEFMDAISTITNSEGYIIFEVPNSENIIYNFDYSQIWEEHCSYFTETSLKNTLTNFGFSIVKIINYKNNDENVLVAITKYHPNSIKHSFNKKAIYKEIKNSSEFTNRFVKVKEEIHSFFSNCEKPVAIFGAGHQTCIFVNLFKLKNKVDCFIDDNPNKQGLYVPGSKLPVKNSSIIYNCEVKNVIFGLNQRTEKKLIQKFTDLKERINFYSINPLSENAIMKQSNINNKLLYSKNIKNDNEYFTECNPGIFYVNEEFVTINHKHIKFLKNKTKDSILHRSRICTHKDNDKIHEMIISLDKNSIILPHKHLKKTESFHIIEGYAEVILFDESGSITKIIDMGNYSSGKSFFNRINKEIFHTILVKSDNLVLHEVTNGPFNKEDNVNASWINYQNEENIKNYFEKLIGEVESFKNGK